MGLEDLLARFPLRRELLGEVERRPDFDLVIVGGGIHGAALARLAAFNQLRVLLIERDDYAAGASGHSSRLLHGGLRYLAQGRLGQVAQGLWARRYWMAAAPHLCRHVPFFLLSDRASDRLAHQAGVALYRLLAGDVWRKTPQSLPKEFSSPALVGATQYTDGIMHDGRLVLEHIIAARQEGAICLNHAELTMWRKRADDLVEVEWIDTLTKNRFVVEAGVLVNCAGIWSAEVAARGGVIRGMGLRLSRGSHLVFSAAPPGAAAVFRKREGGLSDVGFVWPHGRYTFLGTTEREMSVPVDDPVPEPDEVRELLDIAGLRLPAAGLDASRLVGCYAGIRALPGTNDAPTAALSRAPSWIYDRGMLTLRGGKFTTAPATALRGLKQVFSLARLGRKVVSLAGRRLPGGGVLPDEIDEIARQHPELVAGVLARVGRLSRFFFDVPDGWSPVSNCTVKGELVTAHIVEQAETFDDVIRRRLFLGHGSLPAGEELRALYEHLAHLSDDRARTESYFTRVRQAAGI